MTGTRRQRGVLWAHVLSALAAQACAGPPFSGAAGDGPAGAGVGGAPGQAGQSGGHPSGSWYDGCTGGTEGKGSSGGPGGGGAGGPSIGVLYEGTAPDVDAGAVSIDVSGAGVGGEGGDPAGSNDDGIAGVARSLHAL